jgi:hypothetical protein
MGGTPTPPGPNNPSPKPQPSDPVPAEEGSKLPVPTDEELREWLKSQGRND